jgi:Protein kinase domain
MDQLVSKILRDRYHIQSLLGRQTGRRTFLANDLQTGSPTVVKLLLFSPDFTWDELKLFEREAEVLKFLDHFAIPQYLDCFEVETELGKGFALVQTYIQARSLQDWIQSGRTFSEEELKAIAKQLLGILDYLHNRQPAVIHRDIKPSNILLNDRSGHSPGQVYLIDFGSVQTAVHGGTRTVVGTYGYMPLEQFGGQSTPSSDLYALGATLIYLATGQHPDQLPQQAMRILFEDRVNLSPHLIDWLQGMTEPSIDLRLKSANQALEALEQSNLRARRLPIATKSVGSKVHVTITRKMFEILILADRLDCITKIGVFGCGSLSIWFIGWLLIGIFSPPGISGWPLVGAILLLGGALWVYWDILFFLFGKVRLRITQSEISEFREILGLRCWPVRTAARQDIVKIELTSLCYKKYTDGSTIRILPQITIWAGTKMFVLGGDKLGGDKYLTSPEYDWLAQELSSWLNLPITRGLYKDDA